MQEIQQVFILSSVLALCNASSYLLYVGSHYDRSVLNSSLHENADEQYYRMFRHSALVFCMFVLAEKDSELCLTNKP